MSKYKNKFPSTITKKQTEPVIKESQPTTIPYKIVEKKELPKKTPIVKKKVIEVKYREVVYLGVADEAERIGAVTGTQYIFRKDRYRMPVATQVNERDYSAIVAEKGRGCARKSPEILFMSKIEWNLELEQARVANR